MIRATTLEAGMWDGRSKCHTLVEEVACAMWPTPAYSPHNPAGKVSVPLDTNHAKMLDRLI